MKQFLLIKIHLKPRQAVLLRFKNKSPLFTFSKNLQKPQENVATHFAKTTPIKKNLMSLNKIANHFKKNMQLICVLFASRSIVTQILSKQQFIDMLNLEHPSMASVKTAVNNNDLQTAVDAWKNSTINRRRSYNLNEFHQHSNAQNGTYVTWADYLVGKLTEEAYKNHPRYRFYTCKKYSGLPGSTPPINWVTPITFTVNDNSTSTYSVDAIGSGTNLTMRYWQTNENIYVLKYLDLVKDFSSRHKMLVDAVWDSLTRAEQSTLPTSWRTFSAQSTINQAWRIPNIIENLALISKNLPGETKISDWNHILSEIRSPAAPQLMAQIPTDDFMQIVGGLIRDNPAVMIERYKYAEAVPNQRLSGLKAILMMGFIFPEFKDAPSIAKDGTEGLTDFLQGMYHIDGGALEQSFNYNLNQAREITALKNLLLGMDAANSSLPFILLIDQAIARFERMQYALRTPLFSLPLVGNNHHSSAKKIWKEPIALTNWRNEQTASAYNIPFTENLTAYYKDENKPAPTFESISMPYSGYQVQRTGWQWDALYLFMNTAKASRGHQMADNNSIQITVFGRNLITTDGITDYYSWLPPLLTKNLSAQSTFKTNTIMVDALSQTKRPQILKVTNKTLDQFYSHSNSLDYMEGTYNQGYGQIGRNKPVEVTTEHQRNVVFLKEEGLWLLDDVLKKNGDPQTHQYTQIWNFPSWNAGKKEFVGFLEDQVVIGTANKRVYTADTAGPNISIRNFGSFTNYTHTKYYEDDVNYLGYASPIISVAEPAVDVHIGWSANTDHIVGSILQPFEGATQPVINSTDNSTKRNLKLDFTSATGAKVVYRSGLDVQQEAHWGISFHSNSFLAVQKENEDVYGYVKNDQTKGVLNFKGTLTTHNMANFQFYYNHAAKTITCTSFIKADTFAWSPEDKPIYNTNPSAPITTAISEEFYPVFAQVTTICEGEALSSLPTLSENNILGSWSPALNNMETTTYTFTPNPEEPTSITAQMTIEVIALEPIFHQIDPINIGDFAALPDTSLNGLTGTWEPAFNNTETTTYTFTANSTACGSPTIQMTILVNPDTNNNGISDTIDKNMVVKGAAVFVSPTTFLYVASDLLVATDASLTATSDDTNSAAIIVKGNATGDLTYKRYLKGANDVTAVGNSWHLITAPVGAQDIKTFAEDPENAVTISADGLRYALAKYVNNNVSGTRWEYYTANTIEKFTAGKGYATQRASSGVYTFKGALPNKDVPITVALEGSSHLWTSVGNPYPSFLAANNDVNSLLKENEALLDINFTGLYVWNSSTQLYDASNYTENVNQDLIPGQAIMLRFKNTNLTFNFSKSLQKPQESVALNFSKTAPLPSVVVSLTNAEKTVHTKIKYLSNATTGLDVGYDAGAYQRGTPSFAINSHLITDSNGIDFTLQCLPNTAYESYNIPLSVYATANETLSFSAQTTNIPQGIVIYLKDALENIIVPIDENPYKVTLTENTQGIGRFYLRSSSEVLSVADIARAALVNLYKTNNNNLRITGFKALEKATLTLYSVIGTTVFSTKFTTQNVNDIPLPKLPAGLYIATVRSENKMFTKKIIIE